MRHTKCAEVTAQLASALQAAFRCKAGHGNAVCMSRGVKEPQGVSGSTQLLRQEATRCPGVAVGWHKLIDTPLTSSVAILSQPGRRQRAVWGGWVV